MTIKSSGKSVGVVALCIVVCLMLGIFAFALGESVGWRRGLSDARASACLYWCDTHTRLMTQGDYYDCANACEDWRCP